MKIKFLITVLIPLLAFVLWGCKHTTPQPPVNNIDTYAAELFNYNYGSYWVYKNTSTYDSMHVKGIDKGYDTVKNEFFLNEIGSIILNYEVDYYIKRLNNSGKTLAFINYNLPYGVTFEMVFANGIIDSNGLAPYSYIETLYNYQVNQYNFPQVLKVYSVPGDSTRYIIYAPNVGIVEKRLDITTSAFKLINYKIVN